MTTCLRRSRPCYASKWHIEILWTGLTRHYRFQSKATEEEDLEEERPKVRGSKSNPEQPC
jgi:hypothetical protein